jgi:hypothetical protein
VFVREPKEFMDGRGIVQADTRVSFLEIASLLAGFAVPTAAWKASAVENVVAPPRSKIVTAIRSKRRVMVEVMRSLLW